MATPEGFTPEFLDDVYAIFAEYVSLEELQVIMEAATYEAVRASLSGATQPQVLEAARTAAASLVTRMGEEMQRQLAEKIATGLEQQLGSEGTARLIKDGLGLDSNREKALAKYREQLEAQGKTGDALEKAVEKERLALINDRAKTIASTEIGRAIEEGAFVNAKNQGNTHKIWITTGEVRVCPICEANQAQGPIPIDSAFDSGDLTPPAHPGCFCSLGYVADTGKGEVDRAAKHAEERAAMLAEKRESESANAGD